MSAVHASAMAPWQQRVHDRAAAALAAGRLGHGLLLAGPARLGKRAVAEQLARRVLCDAPSGDGQPCGACRSCRLLDARSQTDPVEVRPDGSLAHPWGHSGHPDLLMVGHAINHKARPPKPRTEITIDQIRELAAQLALTPQYGKGRVAIIDPADAINHSAVNALLKTLEEPVPGRYLWLVTDSPARLPATIRSRCQALEFRLPATDEALQWLQARGHGAEAASQALHIARGHPGQADQWLREGVLELRNEVLADLERIASGRAPAPVVAQAWTEDGKAPLRLALAAEFAVEKAASNLTAPARARSLAAWFDRANRARDLLASPVRADLLLVEVLLAWRALGPRGEG